MIKQSLSYHNLSQKGFTLIEVLVAFLVLAIGLLGVASMQTFSVKSSANSNLRSVALYLANDMADRVRANRDGVAANAYNDLTGMTPNSCASKCNATEIANNDKHEWNEQVTNNLPNGTAAISNNNGNFTITITWLDRVKQVQEADDTDGTPGDGDAPPTPEDPNLGTDTSQITFRFQV